MNHDTGKSCKLKSVKDMGDMQTLPAECLEMERATSKEITGKKHLERTDYIIAKQKQEAERAKAEKDAAKAERDVALREADKAKTEQEKLKAGNEEKERRSAELRQRDCRQGGTGTESRQGEHGQHKIRYCQPFGQRQVRSH